MIKKTLKEVEELLGARGLAEKYYNIKIEGVSTDSRQVREGQLFFPLVGESFDGHDFIEAAMAQGAAALVSSRKLEGDLPVIYVEDSLRALQDLATAYLEEVDPVVIGITGSNGKTSTKDILASILKRSHKTHKTLGNFNNYIGLPLTILDMEADVEYAVLEMGIDHFGEMDLLSKIARPDLGLITNAGEAHLDDLGSKENVALAKMEFLANMKEGASYFYFKDDENLDRLSSKVPARIKVINYGLAEDSNYQVRINNLTNDGCEFTIDRLSKDPFFLPLIGRHQVLNATAAIAIADYLGIGLEDIRLGLENVEATGMRNELRPGRGFTILDDSYKSNPSSLRAALDSLYSLEGYKQKIAIIGDMLGIGDNIEEMHRAIGRELDPEKLDYLIAIGYYSEYIVWEAEKNFPAGQLIHFEEKPDNIKEVLEGLVEEGALILVKASRPLALDTIVKDLLED